MMPFSVLDALGLDKVSLLAHGLGTPPAQSFAAADPAKVASVVVIQGFARLTSCDGYEVLRPSVCTSRLRRVAKHASCAMLGERGTEMPLRWLPPPLDHDNDLFDVWGREPRGSAVLRAVRCRADRAHLPGVFDRERAR